MKTKNSQWVLRLVAGILPFYLFTFKCAGFEGCRWKVLSDRCCRESMAK